MDLIQQLQDLSDNHLTNLGPTIVTRAEFIEEARKCHAASFPNVEFKEPEHVPDIQVIWETTNDGHARVVIELWDIGDPDEKIYDTQFTVCNCDNVGPRIMLSELQRCVEQFYEMGLDTKFGRIVEG